MPKSLRDVLLCIFEDFKDDDDYYSGHLNGDVDYDKFTDRIRGLGFSFAVRSSWLGESKESNRFVFCNERGGMKIPFFGCPFQCTKTLVMECVQGPSRSSKRKTAIQNDLKEHPMTKKRRNPIQPTKKLGCPAKLTVKCIKLYPDYNLDKEHFKRGGHHQKMLMKKLKGDLADPSMHVKTLLRYHISLSKESVHNHPTVSTELRQQLHPKLIKEIEELVSRNICSVKAVKRRLAEYVQRMYKDTDVPQPSGLNRCYYPTDKIIYNHILSASSRFNHDQTALEEIIHTWKLESSSDNLYFRAFNQQEDGESRVETFLFCFQSKYQKCLMQHYGHNICVLDVTYKTTKNGLYLFFIVVKTDDGYEIVGVFIIQSETVDKIREALSIFISWNEEWNPQYFLTDNSEPELTALEEAFPRSTVYVCPSHRELAWNRWLKRAGNVHRGQEKPIRSLWRSIASAKTPDDYSNSLAAWLSSDAHDDNPKAGEYIIAEWLPQVHRWVPALQSGDFVWKAAANAGAKNRNQILKQKFFQDSSDKTVTGMIRELHDKFLRTDETLESELPLFLRNRTLQFTHFVWKRYQTAQSEYSCADIQPVEGKSLDDGLFVVKNESNDEHLIDFEAGTCTCHDFHKWQLPCKHMCAIFIHLPDWPYKRLPERYLKECCKARGKNPVIDVSLAKFSTTLKGMPI